MISKQFWISILFLDVLTTYVNIRQVYGLVIIPIFFQLMEDMQKVVNNPHWIESCESKWKEAAPKIIRQGELESPHRSKVRSILEEIDRTGKVSSSNWSACHDIPS